MDLRLESSTCDFRDMDTRLLGAAAFKMMLLCRNMRCSMMRTRTENEMDQAITFTLRGKTFDKRKDDFIKAMKGVEPGRIQKYSTIVGGKRYPIRQVLASTTKLPAIAITSQDAYRVLERFGFKVDTEE